MRSFIALFALAAIATVADAAVAAPKTDEAEENSVAVADPAAAEAAVATPEDRAVGECPKGFIKLAKCAGDSDTCVRVGSPLKYVSWLHLQYQCDSAGGYLPEVNENTKAPLGLLLRSYDQLFGETTLYLGATDITADGTWKWLSSGGVVDDAEFTAKPSDADSADVNTDCMTQSSKTLEWGAVNCEKNSEETQIANICFAAVQTAE